MYNDKEREELTEKTKDIVVIRLNMNAINKDIDEAVKREATKAGDSSFAPKIKPNEYFSVRGKLGIIKGTNILIDDECIGEASEKPSIDIFSETKDENGKTTGFSLGPSFSTKMNIEDTINEYADGEISLQEFMGNRFCYNSRVCSNMRDLIKELKNKN